MSQQKKTKPRTSYLDVVIGKNLKHIRRMNRFSQVEIASQLDLTFQQIQKYESGKNRLSASRMYQISKLLGTELSEFFKGLDDSTQKVSTPLPTLDKKTIELITLFQNIPSPQLQTSLLNILRQFVKTSTIETKSEAECKTGTVKAAAAG